MMCIPFHVWRHLQVSVSTLLQANSHGNQATLSPSDSDDDDDFAALSEIAAPEPVNQDLEVGHVYLEQAVSGSESDIFSRLSEVAAPEPVQRRNSTGPRRPSLEDNILYLSRRHHSG